MKKEMRLVQCTVNGRPVAEYVDVRESLLDMLRNRLGLTSVKKGCEVGECGACTVILDGETIDSCIYLAVWADGKEIRTLEGLEKNGELTRIQQAFIEEGAVQCGFLYSWFHYVCHSSPGKRDSTVQRCYPQAHGWEFVQMYRI